jgi:2-hydroxychromene-2-carboxylate isomerase
MTGKPAARYFFSFRSPYSWLAHRELTKHHPETAKSLSWVPFWEPDPGMTAALEAAGGRVTYTPMSRPKHLYILQDVRRLCQEQGLALRWPVDRNPRWEVPHLAYLVAAEEGRGPQFVDAVYEARWLRGADICDPATIREVAAETGLDPEPLAGAADDPAVRAVAVAALLWIDRDGVFGVPFFTYGYDKYWGLERLSPFLDRLDGDAARAAGILPADWHGTADLDHAGGCG